MNTFNLKLDLDKTPSIPEWVTIRQGDRNGTTIEASIYDHGTLLTGSYGTRVAIRLPDGEHYYRKVGTFSSGVASVTIDETEAASVTGSTVGHFDIIDGSTVIASTADFGVRIMRSVTEGAEPGETYDDAIQEAIDGLNEAVAAIPDTVEGILEDHPEWTTTVQDGSVTDAKLVQSGGVLDRVGRLMYRLDNLLTATPAEGDAATVADAAQTPVAGLALYGRSTQDGTPTPSAPVAIQSVGPQLYDPTTRTERTNNGITWTPTERGVKVSGTASGTSYFSANPSSINDPSLVHVQAGTYTVYNPALATIYVVGYTTISSSTTLVNNSAAATTFTVSQETWLFINFRVNSGVTVDKEYEVSIYEGSAAYPFVPAGCVGLQACGKNLLPHGYATRTLNGITITPSDDGTYTINGTCTSSGDIEIFSVPWQNGGIVPMHVGVPYTFSASTPSISGFRTSLRVTNLSTGGHPNYYNDGVGYEITSYTPTVECAVTRLYIHVTSGTVLSNVVIRPQLEVGTTATAYQPYAESIVPIDLQGHELRSLPDGTRDEVTVSVDGRATLVQRVGSVTVTNVTAYGFSTSSNGSAFYVYPSGMDGCIASTGADNVGLCSIGSYHVQSSDGTDHFYGYSNRVYYRTAAQLADTAAATSWANDNPLTLIYKLATPQTIDLGTVPSVALQGPDMTAQMVPTAPFALTYERDLNLTLARLEAAIADAATA